jgi:hypothetical protein
MNVANCGAVCSLIAIAGRRALRCVPDAELSPPLRNTERSIMSYHA